MSFAITGLDNTNAFYSQHYLDDIVERDLKALFDQWKEQGAASPVAGCAALEVRPTSAHANACWPNARPPTGCRC